MSRVGRRSSPVSMSMVSSGRAISLGFGGGMLVWIVVVGMAAAAGQGGSELAQWNMGFTDFQFTVMQVNGGSVVQMSEVSVYNATGLDAMSAADRAPFDLMRVYNGSITVTNPGGSNPSDEDPENLVDGVTSSDWADSNMEAVFFSFPSAVSLAALSFDWATASDLPDRDPVDWVLYGSRDGGNTWDVLHNTTAFAPSSTRSQFQGPFDLRALSPSPTASPTARPSGLPTSVPTMSAQPTPAPTLVPTSAPTQCSGGAAPTSTATTHAVCQLPGPSTCAGNFRYYTEVAASDSPINIDPVGTGVAYHTFADLDGDGDFDLVLADEGYTAPRFYWNTGTAAAADFEETGQGRANPLFGLANCTSCGRSPDFADWDDDGDYDLLMGSKYRAVPLFFNNTGSATSPVFTEVNDSVEPWSSVVDALGTTYATPTACDLDNDGDLDIVSGSWTFEFIYIENTGSVTEPRFVQRADDDNPFQGLGSLYDQTHVFMYDYDQDGDFDVMASSQTGEFHLFANRGTPETPYFEELSGSANVFADITVNGAGGPSFFDLMNNDGHAELAWSGQNDFILYENVGSEAVAPVLTELDSDLNPYAPLDSVIDGYRYVAPMLGDLDDDGDKDLILPNQRDFTSFTVFQPVSIDYYINNGSSTSPNFVLVEDAKNPFAGIAIARVALTEPWDWDDDGDLDIVVTRTTDSNEYSDILFLENIGNATHSQFVQHWSNSSANPAQNITFNQLSSPGLVDFNNDGLKDLVLGLADGTFVHLVNVGNATHARLERSSDNPLDGVDMGYMWSMTTADIDGDSDDDIVGADSSGQLFVVENLGYPACPYFDGTHEDTVLDDADFGYLVNLAIVDIDDDGDVDFTIARQFYGILLYVNGRCIPEEQCSNRGLCTGESFQPTCQCLLGYVGDQCSECLSGFFSAGSCALCPGGGTSTEPTLSNVCSARGVCFDGEDGNGTCACNSPFNGTDCSQGKCPQGQYLSLDASTSLYECSECATGTYKGNAGNDQSCLRCDAGSFANATGLSACLPCVPGTSSSSTGSSTCSACVSGRYAASNGSTTCAACAAGAYANRTGSTTCDPCPRGRFSSSTGSSECTACPAGSVAASNGSTTCVACGAGTYAPESGLSECLACPVGRFVSSTGSSTCTECPSGFVATGEGASSCTACEAGTYASSASENCTACPVGRFASSTGSSTCTECPSGFVATGEGASICTACEAGAFAIYNTTSEVSTCLPCGPGTSSSSTGSSTCSACVSGRYAASNGSTTCAACTAGTYANRTGSTTCDPCPRGRFSSSTGLSECTACPAGSVAASNGSTTCVACGAGTYAPESGLSECLACPVGRFVSSTGSSTCTECPSGFVATGEGASSCTACEAGTYASSASENCTACPVGRYSSSAGSRSCVPCAVGFFAEQNGSVFCSECDRNNGYTTMSEGMSNCSGCLEDFFWDGRRHKCEACEDGMDCSRAHSELEVIRVEKQYWRVDSFSTLMEQCPSAGHACPGGNGTGDELCATGYEGPLCSVCSDRYYYDPGASKCRACTEAGTSPTTIIVTVVVLVIVLLVVVLVVRRQGRVQREQDARLLAEADDTEAAADRIRKRREKERHQSMMRLVRAQTVKLARKGSSVGVIHTHAPSTRAPTSCSPRSRQQQQQQQQPLQQVSPRPGEAADTSGTDTAGGAATESTAVEEATEDLLRSDVSAGAGDTGSTDTWQSWRHKVKILISAAQVITAFPFALQMEYPSAYQEMLASLSFVNLQFLQILPSECVWDTDHIDKVVFMTVGPLVVAALLGLLWRIHTWRRPRADHAELTADYIELFLLLSYLVFPSVSTAVFSTFSCRELDNGESYMRVDMSIDCSSDRYAFGVAWAAFMVAVYPVGIPALYLIMLRSVRDAIDADEQTHPEIHKRALVLSRQGDMHMAAAVQTAKAEYREDNPALQPYAFLFEAYEPRCWYWEIVECARRLLLTGMMVFFFEGTAVQVAIGILISQGSIVAYAQLQPYIDITDDVMQQLVQLQIFLILFATLLLRVDVAAEDAESQQAFGVVLIMVTLAAPIMGFMFLARDYWSAAQELSAAVVHPAVERARLTLEEARKSKDESKCTGSGDLDEHEQEECESSVPSSNPLRKSRVEQTVPSSPWQAHVAGTARQAQQQEQQHQQQQASSPDSQLTATIVEDII